MFYSNFIYFDNEELITPAINAMIDLTDFVREKASPSEQSLKLTGMTQLQLYCLKTATKPLPLLNDYYEKYKILQRVARDYFVACITIQYYFQEALKLSHCRNRQLPC